MDHDENPETASPARHGVRRPLIGRIVAPVALVAVAAVACGGGSELAGPRLEDEGAASTVVDPNTGETYEIPEDFDLAFGDGSSAPTADADADAPTGDGGGDDPDSATEGEGTDGPADAPPPIDDDPAPPAHPLEEVVIDETIVAEDAGSLDESGSLACAQAEFALDALIADDTAALADHLARATALAAESSVVGLGARAAELTGGASAATEAAVVDFLTVCTESGYEL